MLVVTTDSVPGYEVQQVLGEVIGVTGRTRNPFREGVKKLHGGGNPLMVQALTRWRREALGQMTRQAYRRGANAVVGMRFDARNISDMWAEICAYGTAVFVVPAASPPAAVPGVPPAAVPGVPPAAVPGVPPAAVPGVLPTAGPATARAGVPPPAGLADAPPAGAAATAPPAEPSPASDDGAHDPATTA
jgi:uncharacterized protein YbjQ (UPF0145 family)